MKDEIKYHTKEEAIQAVTQCGNELRYCTPELQNNEEVVIAATKKDSWSFCYASLLRSKKAFVIKALNEGVNPRGLLDYANISLKFDFEVIALALEKSDNGLAFYHAEGKVALNKELAAKALVKWGAYGGSEYFDLWENIHPTLQEIFPEDSWYEKAQAYLHYLEQSKNVLGGSTEEDEIVW